MQKQALPLTKSQQLVLLTNVKPPIVWEKATGTPVYNAIVWQCRRTADITDKLKADGHEEYIRNTTGLVVDPYFSGTKVKWIFRQCRRRARKSGTWRASIWYRRYLACVEINPKGVLT